MAVSGRDTPPSIQDGDFGYEPDSVDFLGMSEPEDMPDDVAKRLAQDGYDSSTTWINASRRRDWANSLRAFQSVHPSGSKYHSSDYAYRSALYRPKTRAMVRKAEAQTASAFFSNEDVVSIDAVDDDDPMQQASAEFMGYLLQYRLTKSIPWFLTVVGARQDAEVMGFAVAKTYWRFSTRKTGQQETKQRLSDETGMVEDYTEDVTETVEDKPHIDLIAGENFRFDPGADWRDPINTSPYIIELIPMYMNDVMELMESGEWESVAPSALRRAGSLDDDTTRRERERFRMPGKGADNQRPRSYDIVWVHSNIFKWHGRDWFFYSLHNAPTLLTKPVLLEQEFFHGIRPYVFGFIVPETHKSYPSSKAELVSDLQRGANDDWNLRFDNVKLALNPRQLVRAGSGIEINDVQRMMPGKAMITNNPKEDVVWDRPPDVTQSAYAEQDRINLDFDELVGDFSNSSVQATQIQEQSATGMHLMSGQAAGMVEYELKVFVETFVEAVLRQLIKLLQAYETDPVVLALAGKKANLIQKYGISNIDDNLLNQELTMRVNVGIGATNPATRLKNFSMGGDILGKFFGPALAQGANFQEVSKEVFAYLGYKDGARFFSPQFDPRVQMLQQQLQEAQKKAGAGKAGADPQAQMQEFQAKSALMQQQGQIDMQQKQAEAQNDQSLAAIDMQKTQMQEDAETKRLAASQAHEAMQNTAQRHHDWLSTQLGAHFDEKAASQQAVHAQDDRLPKEGRPFKFTG